jgi:hypothetical protein
MSSLDRLEEREMPGVNSDTATEQLNATTNSAKPATRCFTTNSPFL